MAPTGAQEHSDTPACFFWICGYVDKIESWMEPMKIWILSDLHHRLRADMRVASDVSADVPNADVCVLPGDVCDNMEASLEWVGREIAPKMPVVMVPGNHEFYGYDVPTARRMAAGMAQASGIRLLDDGIARIGGVTFAGSTLWTDFRLFEGTDAPDTHSRSACMYEARRKFADFDEIWATEASDRQMARLLTPRDACVLNAAGVEFLRGLAPPDGPLVVVTHHAPSVRSVAPEYAGLATTAAFASRLDDVVAGSGAALWIHGHLHQSADYRIGGTRVVCNPRGPENRQNPGYDPALVIEI